MRSLSFYFHAAVRINSLGANRCGLCVQDGFGPCRGYQFAPGVPLRFPYFSRGRFTFCARRAFYEYKCAGSPLTPISRAAGAFACV